MRTCKVKKVKKVKNYFTLLAQSRIRLPRDILLILLFLLLRRVYGK